MNILAKLLRKRQPAFTLIEMLVVLLIVSVLLLLFVPNISKQKEHIEASGGRALVKVVESQAELYALSHEDQATLSSLVAADFISQDQADKYAAYYATNSDQPQQVPH